MTIVQILAWPGTAPTILLTTVALHFAMFSRRWEKPVKGAMVAMALIVPSLATLFARVVMPPSGVPTENLMAGLFEAMLLALCLPLTVMSVVVWITRKA